MATIITKLKEYIKANGVEFKDRDFFDKVIVRDDWVDGVSNPYIEKWTLDIPKPTDEQLASYEAAANIAEANAQVDFARVEAYGSWGDQLDEIYHNIDAWKARIAKIKADNPKS